MNLEELRNAFEHREYQKVIAILSDRENKTPEEDSLLGISFLRTNNPSKAERFLLSAQLRGDVNAKIEYGNLLRIQGKYKESISHLNKTIPLLSGEHKLLCLRWLGISYFKNGNVDLALNTLEEAKLGYIILNKDLMSLKIDTTMANCFIEIGDHHKAKVILENSISYIKDKNNTLYLTALHSLANLSIEEGNYEYAEELISEIDIISENIQDKRMSMYGDILKAYMALLTGDYGDYISLLNKIRLESIIFGEKQAIEWSYLSLANHYSKIGNHSEALRLITEFKSQYPQKTLFLKLIEGVMARRNNKIPASIRILREVQSEAKISGMRYDEVRAQLQVAYSQYLLNDYEGCSKDLIPAIEGILELSGGKGTNSIRQEIEELGELLYFASLQPEMSVYLPIIMEHLADLSGALPPDVFSPSSLLEISTLGHQSVSKDGIPASFTSKDTVPVLAFLALHPNSTRQDIQQALFPDRDPDSAGALVRKCLQAIREGLGGDVLLSEGPYRAPRYRLSRKVNVVMDSQKVLKAVTDGNLPAALASYKGVFLQNFEGSEWVDSMRDRVQNGVLLTLERNIQMAEDARDWQRMILHANQYLRVDPYSVDMAERRLRAARYICTPAELANYMADWNRLKN